MVELKAHINLAMRAGMVGHHVVRQRAVRDRVFDHFRRHADRVVATAVQRNLDRAIVGGIVVQRDGPVECAAAFRGKEHHQIGGRARLNHQFGGISLEQGVAGAGKDDVGHRQHPVAAIADGQGMVGHQAHADLAEVQRRRSHRDFRGRHLEEVHVGRDGGIAHPLRIILNTHQAEGVIPVRDQFPRNIQRNRDRGVATVTVHIGPGRHKAGRNHRQAPLEVVGVAGDKNPAIHVLNLP